MEQTLNKLIDSISANAPRSDKEYLGKDGLLHCSICHAPTQTRLTNPLTGEERVVFCVCNCKTDWQEFKERQQLEEIDRRRNICFEEANMANWTFANDDRQNEKISNAMQRYVENFTEFRRDGKGLLLYGTVGTGKSYHAASIANALIDKGYSCLMTNFARLTNKIQGMFEGKQEYIDSLNKYSLLIIDDLGVERKTEYMAEQVYNIIDARYRSGLPFIITTNLTWEELTKPSDIAYSRIYDRVVERCFPVEVKGVSRRRQKVKDTYLDTKNKLGL